MPYVHRNRSARQTGQLLIAALDWLGARRSWLAKQSLSTCPVAKDACGVSWGVHRRARRAAFGCRCAGFAPSLPPHAPARPPTARYHIWRM
eukprot:5668311-Pleurochrysis_carterae.AAC.1